MVSGHCKGSLRDGEGVDERNSVSATGKALEKAGVVSGADITTESALAKLFYLMGKTTDNESVKSKLGDNLQGEISL